jgi:hypothetical protein
MPRLSLLPALAKHGRAAVKGQAAKPATTYHRLRITLGSAFHALPSPVWRIVQVASDATLKELHEVIQAVMGWPDDGRLHEFRGRGRFVGPPLLQESWVPVPGDEDEAMVQMVEFLPRVRMRLLYEFGMGLPWQHDLRLEKVERRNPGEPFAVLLKGEGKAPDAEDAFDLRVLQARVAALRRARTRATTLPRS